MVHIFISCIPLLRRVFLRSHHQAQDNFICTLVLPGDYQARLCHKLAIKDHGSDGSHVRQTVQQIYLNRDRTNLKTKGALSYVQSSIHGFQTLKKIFEKFWKIYCVIPLLYPDFLSNSEIC